ncbi:inward rectifier potassium channel 2-like isoform X7 isoform B [Chlorella sorokiniana]|uniref:Inward rectifier potassium channel 2-like isoform X7 isoform B n=1 Tax=Chlorella sorokiniana TaxID=3076 RepID=A0A2P6TGI1_CHLSO|nr:inward rectifier potassium channel 2-like isoform X7 isoform B [Chlorella sorokiniana]|eukprot:PRW33237.1 inward rectifier potassium channel 2-like isoform X7 isoform B [Chlorella sorokiniana]
MAMPAFTPRSSGYSTPTGTTGGMSTPLLSGRVLDSRRVVVERHFGGRRYRGLHWYYLSDLFHTLVNCPWYRFYLIFVVAYVTMYSLFAAFYISQPGCITKVSNFWHALWFSVESSATIGYGHQAPDPQCYLLQFGVMAQVLVSLMMQGSLLGLVFARISNSSGRTTTIRFSKVLSMYQGDDGLWRLAFRVANLRQHQVLQPEVLQPEVRMLMLRRSTVHPFSSVHSEFIYSELKTEHVGGGRLWLGVPSVIEHRIDRGSPLWGMSDADMRAADMEIIVLLDGIDESTSRAIEARHSYVPFDIRWQHHFDPCIQRRRSGKIGPSSRGGGGGG